MEERAKNFAKFSGYFLTEVSKEVWRGWWRGVRPVEAGVVKFWKNIEPHWPEIQRRTRRSLVFAKW